MAAVFPLLFLSAVRVLGVLAESPVEPYDDFSPAVAVVSLIFICIVIIFLGIGIAIALIMAAAVAVLAGIGILSSSVLIGIFKRRLSSGLRALHYQVCAFIGIPAGIGILRLGSWLTQSTLGGREILTIGAAAGVCGGLLLAFLFDLAARTFYRKWLAPLITTESVKEPSLEIQSGS